MSTVESVMARPFDALVALAGHLHPGMSCETAARVRCFGPDGLTPVVRPTLGGWAMTYTALSSFVEVNDRISTRDDLTILAIEETYQVDIRAFSVPHAAVVGEVRVMTRTVPSSYDRKLVHDGE